MSNRVHIICHPLSGNGKGREALHDVQRILNNYRIEAVVHTTDYARHAETLTQQIIAKGYKPFAHYLMVIGGDGTLHEVLSVLTKANARIPITYIPAGTGNDFARAWLKGKSNQQIIEKMLFSRKPVTIPIFHYYEKISQREGVIANNMGFGFDAQVNANTQSKQPNFLNKIGLGRLNYLVNVFTSLSQLKYFTASGEIDGHYFKIDNIAIASIVNNPFLGGGIIIDNVSDAKRFEIALVFYHDIKARNIPELVYKVLIKKNQSESSHFSRLIGNNLNLTIHEDIIGHVDGEIIPAIPAQLEISLANYPFYI